MENHSSEQYLLEVKDEQQPNRIDNNFLQPEISNRSQEEGNSTVSDVMGTIGSDSSSKVASPIRSIEDSDNLVETHSNSKNQLFLVVQTAVCAAAKTSQQITEIDESRNNLLQLTLPNSIPKYVELIHQEDVLEVRKDSPPKEQTKKPSSRTIIYPTTRVSTVSGDAFGDYSFL